MWGAQQLQCKSESVQCSEKQQSSLNFSEPGRRRGHSYYLLALRLLDYMRFAMEASTEWKRGAHTPAPQPWNCG